MNLAASPSRIRVSTPLELDFQAIDPKPFEPLFHLSDEALRGLGVRRVIAPENPGINYPCRVSLGYPQAGEELILVNYRHLDIATSPYRAEGPVFMRRDVLPFRYEGAFPAIIMQRAMAVRGYDRQGMMVEAELAEKEELAALTMDWLARGDIDHVDFHSARRGCFFCRARRK